MCPVPSRPVPPGPQLCLLGCVPRWAPARAEPRRDGYAGAGAPRVSRISFTARSGPLRNRKGRKKRLVEAALCLRNRRVMLGPKALVQRVEVPE